MDPFNNLRSYGEALIESVDPAHAEVVAARALAAPSVGLSVRRRILAVAAATATFLTGNVGMAMAADPAVPGDLLHGLDRAYEQVGELVGLSGDHSEERLEEATQLALAGNSADALEAVIQQIHALQSDYDLDASGLDTALVAITAARDRTHEVGNETAATATEQAKEIIAIAHQFAKAAQKQDHDAVKDLLKDLKAAAKAKDNGNGQDKALGPPDDRGNGGDRGNSSHVP
jgi:hypothetical protein